MNKSVLRNVTRIPFVRGLWRKFPAGSIPERVEYGIWNRPYYGYGVYHAANLARRLGLKAITVIEFGVAGGNGLVELENIAREVSRHCGVQIHVAGFDAGIGLPKTLDYRDLPHVWGEGDYQMDVPKLKARLQPGTELVLGQVGETAPAFLHSLQAPIGFVSFDLDYYSSTKDAFAIFNGPAASRLPRVFCYFDDLVWPEEACHNPFVGEYLAIREFNDQHEEQKLAKLENLRWMQAYPAQWHDQMYVLHDFGHPLYTTRLRSTEENQLHL